MVSAEPKSHVEGTAAVCPCCSSVSIRSLGGCSQPQELKASTTHPAVREVVEKLSSSELMRCEECQFVFRSPQLSAADLQQLYQNLPEDYWQYAADEVGSWVTATGYLEPFFQQTKRIVDVGAFDGAFLDLLPQAWEKFAIEPSSGAAAKLDDKGIRHIADFVESDETADYEASFDIVTMFDVFEHLITPRQALKSLLSLLKPGGKLLLSTGDASHWTWRLLRGEHWYLHSAQHLGFGNEEFFREFCERESNAHLERVIQHAHKVMGRKAARQQAIETIHYWAANQSTVTSRLLSRVLRYLPGMSYLVHRQSPPFGNAIKDHMLIVISKVDSVSEQA